MLIGNYIAKTGAKAYPQVIHYVMSRSGYKRKGDSEAESLQNIVAVKGDWLNEDSYPEELKDCQSLVHSVGTLLQGKTPNTSYKAMNTETWVKIAKKFNEYAKITGKQRNFVMISSEKAPPFLEEYITTKREAEEYLLNECTNLRVHILRPGFIVDPTERSWSPYLSCIIKLGYQANLNVVQKTPAAGLLDFLFPAHPTSLEKIGEIALAACHNELPPQVWTNDMILSYSK